MDNATLQRIKDTLQKSQTVAVAVGKNPTVDDMGAALALYLSLQTAGKTASIIAASEPLVEVSNLVGINKVKTGFEGDGSDLTVSFPYREGEIEKVSYTIENNYLNIVVKAGEQGLNFSEQDVRYTVGGGNGAKLDLLIVVGTPRFSDLNQAFDMNLLKDVTVVNIDNKQENQGFGDIVLVSPRFSSVSEQVTQLIQDIAAPMDVDIAQNLLDGILYGTENFQSPRTSFLAFEMAGILMRQGAVRTAVPAPRSSVPQQQPRQDFSPAPMPTQQRPNQQRPQQIQQFGQDRDRDRDRRPQFDNRRSQNQQQQSRFQQPQQPRQQQQPALQQQPVDEQGQDDLNPPTDWLQPKVYKGSSNI